MIVVARRDRGPRPFDALTRAELLAYRESVTYRRPGDYTPPPCTVHRPTAIRYPAGTVYVCPCGWRDARADDTAQPLTLTA